MHYRSHQTRELRARTPGTAPCVSPCSAGPAPAGNSTSTVQAVLL